MATLNLSVTYAPVSGFAPNTVVGSIVAALTGTNPANNQSQSVSPGTTSVVFANVQPDSYGYSVQAFDSATPPNPLGSAVTGTFAVTAPQTITLSLPASVTASQS